ncbi:ribosomal L28 family protein [Colletotrichum karsti]|uniref:Ribosomal L28 family protein n=1 Tax=Colletotrichum karsti TaxID=1095194 RepID=A0A9P6LM47_9PEZI|nr:ribosomal L28 family protein [Colletotrichum karsti]KAF9878458.1 ribosomal L28 family protein [Colletotrichum karsti]
MHLSTLRPGTTSLTSALSSLTLKTTTTTTAARAFSTTPATLTKTIPLHRIPETHVPPYPYGPRLIYKQSNAGLYGTARIRTGHNVSEKHHQVSPRVWRPNVHRRKLWSECLGAWVRTRLTTRVLRTVRKEGGLDEYVLKNKAARVKELGPGGWKLRWLVMQTLEYRYRMFRERRALGVVDRPLPGDNSRLAPIMARVAISGKIRASDQKIIEEMASETVAQYRMRQVQMKQMARMTQKEEEYALGQEAEEGVLEDEEYQMEHIDGPKGEEVKTV